MVINGIISGSYATLLARAEQTANMSPARVKPPVNPTIQAQLRPPITDTVSLSSAALAAYREAAGAPEQTAPKAGTGDQQLRTLLAREAALGKLLWPSYGTDYHKLEGEKR